MSASKFSMLYMYDSNLKKSYGKGVYRGQFLSYGACCICFFDRADTDT